MFIELTNRSYQRTESVNINHIKKVIDEGEEGAAIEWINAPVWLGNPTDFMSFYSESYREVVNAIDYVTQG